MDINKVLQEYDGMFGVKSLTEIEDFLYGKLVEAISEQDDASLFTLLNEMIGFCRDTMQQEKGITYCDSLLGIMDKMQLYGTVPYATALLNIANAYRAFGRHEESFRFFSQTYEIYKMNYENTDFAYANLFNNWSLLYQETGDFEQAGALLKQTLSVVDRYPEKYIQQAVTRTNLASSLLALNSEECYQEALIYLREALDIFEKDGGVDFHYGAALVAMGDACGKKGDFAEAAVWYQKGLLDMEKHIGRNDNYVRVYEKYQNAVRRSEGAAGWKSNLERSREFYERYGKAMIQEKFPEYAFRIAAGMVGEGSDCFGFDDYISSDHDYAPGFCMWLTEADYSAIGERLQAAYEELIRKHGLYGTAEKMLGSRRKVSSINDFYNTILGTAQNYEEGGIPALSHIEEYRLAHAVNGSVFSDGLGIFTMIRNSLKEYYPDSVWRAKLAAALHEFSQYAQSNYPRMMARRDYVTADMCIGKAVESAMDIAYLLNRVYAPYYKWKRKGLERLASLKSMIPLLEEVVLLPVQAEAWQDQVYTSAKLNERDACAVCLEKVAAVILEEMTAQGLVKGTEPFLELYITQIMEGNKKMNVVDRIIRLEWDQFDKVKNEGGRADCQDDFGTFSIMRKSQYMAWSEELLNSYCNDLLEANSKGWNLIMEKYARMMKSTAPQRYAELEKDLPVRSNERINIQEEIIKIQVGWMEAFAEKYPKMAGNARSIHTSEDHAYNTSYETYLRGELGTYSEETFLLYGRFVAGLMQEGRNLAYEIMNNTARLYGYADVEAAEKLL